MVISILILIILWQDYECRRLLKEERARHARNAILNEIVPDGTSTTFRFGVQPENLK